MLEGETCVKLTVACLSDAISYGIEHLVVRAIGVYNNVLRIKGQPGIDNNVQPKNNGGKGKLELDGRWDTIGFGGAVS